MNLCDDFTITEKAPYHKGQGGWLAKILILKDVCP